MTSTSFYEALHWHALMSRDNLQEAQEAALAKPLSEGMLCAIVNNNTRCYNEAMDFAENLDNALAPLHKVPPPICRALKYHLY